MRTVRFDTQESKLPSLDELKKAICVSQFAPGHFTAFVDGPKDGEWFGACYGHSILDARRGMEIYLEDNYGSVEVLLKG